MEEEAVNKKAEEGLRNSAFPFSSDMIRKIEKYSGRRYPRHRLFPPADEAVGTDYGICHLLYP